jgi:hypothetical protein
MATSVPPGTQPAQALIFYQNPVDGTLLPPVSYTLSLENPMGVRIGDINGDGRNDIVIIGTPQPVSGSPDMKGAVSILYQKSDGTLDNEFFYTNVNVIGRDVFIADMDGDGRNDLIVQSDLKQLAVVRQTSSGTLSATPQYYTVQTSYWNSFNAFAVGDLNGDGKNDIAVLDPGNNGYLNIFYQNNSGTLDGPTLIPVQFIPYGIRIADIDGDGLNDIVADYSGCVYVMFQRKDHSFAAPVCYNYYTVSTGGSLNTMGLAVGDVTGDGYNDAVVIWDPDSLLAVLPSVLGTHP